MTLPKGFIDRPFAHRALHGSGRPENSASAIRAAVAGGWGIEVDVQLSSDGRAMVFHDYDLNRLSEETGVIRQRSAKELAEVRLRGSGEGVPTLEEALKLIDGKVPLVVEIKDQDGAMGENIGPLEEATAAALRSYQGPLAVMSFNPFSVVRMAGLLPNVPRGLTSAMFTTPAWDYLPQQVRSELAEIPLDDLGASFISHEARSLDSPRVTEIKAQGLPILCWTIKSAAQEAKARAVADQITFEGYTPA